MPKSKSKITTNKKNMFSKLKRNKRLSKKQTGGVNIVDLYNIKDELFMIYVLDMINFKTSTLETSTNNSTTSIKLTLDIFPNDKYINNTLNTITYTNTAITHKKNMQYKSCSNFTTFFYFIRYLIEIGYLKILKTVPPAQTEDEDNAETEAATAAEKKKEELKRLFITVNNTEYKYIQHVYSYTNSSNKKKVHLTTESPIDHFYNHEIKPYLDTKNVDYNTIKKYRNLYDNYIYTKIYKYEYCDLIYNTFINYAKNNSNSNITPIPKVIIVGNGTDTAIKQHNDYIQYINKYCIGTSLLIRKSDTLDNNIFIFDISNIDNIPTLQLDIDSDGNRSSGNTPSINGHLIDFYAKKLKDFVAYPQNKHDIFIKLNKQVKPINIVYKILYIAYNILNKITTTHSNNT